MDHVFNTLPAQSPSAGLSPFAGIVHAAPEREPAYPDAQGELDDAPLPAADFRNDSSPGSSAIVINSAMSAVALEAGGMVTRDVNELSAVELAKLTELQQRDQEVRSHEQAHIASGGGHVVGGARYSHTEGPDGRQYAVSGEVSIDTSKVPGDPHATIEKAKTVRRAALAPAQPSGQDQAVAAKAQTMETEARMDLMQQRRTEGQAAYAAAAGPELGSGTLNAVA